jgi:PAS domain S-box-containing protein
MALIRSLPRLDLSTVNQTLADAGLGPLTSLSQRKLNALGLPLAYVDRQQRYRFVNTAFLDWLGKREDEVIGREISEVLGPEVYQLYQAYVDAALAGERTGFVRQLTAPGQPAIWIRVDYYPDRGPNNTIRGFLLTYSDVDHLKRLELEAGQREHRLRLVTDSVGLPILYFDREFRLRFANRPFADWIGIPADDLIGHGLKDFLPSDAYEEMIAHVDGVFGGGTMSFERRERKQNGELRWVRVTLFPDREVNGRVGGAFAVWNDIEDDVRVRDALKAQQAQLRLFADNIPARLRISTRACTTRSSTRRSPISCASRATRSTAARRSRSCRRRSHRICVR